MFPSDFTKREIDYLYEECNFTKEQMVLFRYRTSNIPLETCAEMMNVSLSTVNRINKKMKEKIERAEKMKLM